MANLRTRAWHNDGCQESLKIEVREHAGELAFLLSHESAFPGRRSSV
jgi:hypothetical protein